LHNLEIGQAAHNWLPPCFSVKGAARRTDTAGNIAGKMALLDPEVFRRNGIPHRGADLEVHALSAGADLL
jgi:hypothetical protein